MDPEFLHAINGDWDALLTAMRDSHALVRRTDASGMTVLHWVCMHQSAPTDIIVKVIFANPHAVHVRNDAGHLPIDLAIQAECGERILEVLRAAANGSRDRGRSGADLQLYDEDADPSMEVSDYQLPYGDNNRRHQSILDDTHDYQPQQPGRYYDDADDEEEFAYYHHLQQQQLQQQREQQQREQQYQQMQRYQYEQGMGRNQRAMSRDRLIMSSHSSPAPSPHQPYPKFYSPQDAALGQYPIYGNGNGNGRGSMSNVSHRSDHMKSLSLTEQRLRERENDLISIATDDNTPIVFDSHQTHDLTMFGGFGGPREHDNKPSGIPSVAGDNNGGAVGRPRAKTTFPPRWKQARSCHVCATIFSLMKRRHHCRNCGQSVCSQHSTNRVSLPKFGLSEPQRVCDKCFLSGHHMSIGQSGPPSATESFQSHTQFIRAHYG